MSVVTQVTLGCGLTSPPPPSDTPGPASSDSGCILAARTGLSSAPDPGTQGKTPLQKTAKTPASERYWVPPACRPPGDDWDTAAGGGFLACKVPHAPAQPALSGGERTPKSEPQNGPRAPLRFSLPGPQVHFQVGLWG